MAEHQCERPCVDCGQCVCDRPTFAYLCSPCAQARQVAARRAYYLRWKAKHPKAKSRDRLNGTVGNTVPCEVCGTPIVKRSGSHKYCETCIAANADFYRTQWNRRHPDRAHGASLDDGRWGSVAV